MTLSSYHIKRSNCDQIVVNVHKTEHSQFYHRIFEQICIDCYSRVGIIRNTVRGYLLQSV